GGPGGAGGAGKKPAFTVLPVPYDLTTSYVPGARNGPLAMIEASTHMELYDEEFGCEPSEAGIETLPALESTALGPEVMIGRVREAVSGIIEGDGGIPVMLGGEHSITLGAVQALLDKYPALSVLQLDAHADMRDSYQDSPFNHACVARRISEVCPVAQVGVRSLSAEEAAFLKKKGGPGGSGGAGKRTISTYYAQDVLREKSVEKLADRALKDLTGEVFITVDLDVFDPSIMPATGTPEPGGLDWHQVVGILRRVISRTRVLGFDVVELAPIPGIVAPDFMAARLVYKMMAFVNESSKATSRKRSRR
ncbi:MAG TPA: agmatinase, partial [Thermodesulfobacteriota bacterium]|nr:agmatinase [Thermodesulfobacteriota bacterium]